MKITPEQLTKRLKERHISVTPQRLEILKSLMTRYDHPSADNIYQEVRRHLPMISFNTVYKTLETFCQLGLVVKINPLHEVARYDGNVNPHTHLVCTRCHKVLDVDWQWPDEVPLPTLNLADFQATEVAVQIFGLCRKCLAD
ncbi:MAG: transcriptional repressor [Deltaproteobacteria bacterium]|nr:transcriptional repressor [Deltaproteobacteria bacterium]